VVRTRDRKEDKGTEALPPMAKSQEDSITILLGLKGREVRKVSEDEEGIEGPSTRRFLSSSLRDSFPLPFQSKSGGWMAATQSIVLLTVGGTFHLIVQ